MAKAKCVPCLSEEIKIVIREVVKNPETIKFIDSLKDCPFGTDISLCLNDGRRTRAPSAYQSFISTCMKSKPIKGQPFGTASKFMKECSAEWKQKKNV